MKRFSKFIQEAIELDEKLKASDDMGDWVKDFQDSDAPQFKGKSQKKRQQMAVAAKLAAERNEEVELDEISRDLARRYIRKVADKTNTGELSTKQVMKRRPGVNLAGKKAYPGVAGEPRVRATESVTLDELSKKTLGSYIKRAAGERGHAGIEAGASASGSKDQKDAMSTMKKRLKGIKMASDRLTKEEVELDEAKTDIYHKHMLKALGKSRLPKDHSYTSAMANNGDFVVRDGGGRVVGRIPKGEHNLNEVSDKKLDAYRQKAFADQPSGDDGSDKYRKRKFGRDLAFAKQTGRAKVRATKEEANLDEVSSSTLGSYISKADANRQEKDRSKGIDLAVRKNHPSLAAYMKKSAKVNAKEEVELDELKKLTREEVEINEASDLRVTKVYNKFPKKATYAVHTLDRKYYKEFDTEADAKKHLETKK